MPASQIIIITLIDSMVCQKSFIVLIINKRKNTLENDKHKFNYLFSFIVILVGLVIADGTLFIR